MAISTVLIIFHCKHIPCSERLPSYLVGKKVSSFLTKKENSYSIFTISTSVNTPKINIVSSLPPEAPPQIQFTFPDSFSWKLGSHLIQAKVVKYIWWKEVLCQAMAALLIYFLMACLYKSHLLKMQCKKSQGNNKNFCYEMRNRSSL